MSRPDGQTHVLIRQAALQQIRATYPNVSADSLWRVEVVNNAYGRGALHLVRVEKVGGPPSDERIVVWRGQVVGLPRCDYCSIEGHSNSSGTAATCPVRAAEVAALNAKRSRLMHEHWERQRAEAATMKLGPGVPPCPGNTAPAGEGPEPAFSPSGESPF